MRARSILGFLAVAFVLTACGGGVAESDLFQQDPQQGAPAGASQDPNGPGLGGPCSGAAPNCGADCGMDGTVPVAKCVDGKWACVSVKCAPCAGVVKPKCACGEAVCSGRSWSCSSCPGPFACGDRACQTGEVCLERAPGIRYADGGTPPNYYECRKVPAKCAGNETCGCVKPLAQAELMCWGAQCDDTSGHVMLGCMGM